MTSSAAFCGTISAAERRVEAILSLNWRHEHDEQLRSAHYDCVVIGGGLRIPPKGLALFESIVNVVHKAAPGAAIAFNTRPEDTAEAAARQLQKD